MSRGFQKARRVRPAGTILCLLLAGLSGAVFPVPVLGLGGPQPVTVFAEGEVHRPGRYVLPAKATLSSLIGAAGGFTDDADLRGAFLARNSARAAQEAELREMAAALAADAGASDPAREVAREVRELLDRVHPSGRVPVKLTYARLLKNSPEDLALSEGDVLRIPAITTTVAVAGAVREASDRLPFVPGRSYGEYIRQAGGFAADADRGEVFLLRADGSAALLSLGFVSWNATASRWEVTALAGGPPVVGSGDTVVVPRSLPQALPGDVARGVTRILVRAAEIAGAPVILP